MRIYRHRLRGDIAADWTADNPPLLLDEPGVEQDTGRLKIGDGITLWNDLPYLDEMWPGGGGGGDLSTVVAKAGDTMTGQLVLDAGLLGTGGKLLWGTDEAVSPVAIDLVQIGTPRPGWNSGYGFGHNDGRLAAFLFSTATSGGSVALRGSAEAEPAADGSGGIRGVHGDAWWYGDFDLNGDSVCGIYGDANQFGSGNIAVMQGVFGQAYLWEAQGGVGGAGTADVVAAFDTYLGLYSTGKVDELFGLRVRSPDGNVAGSVGQAYGVYIGDMVVGNHDNPPYALYTAGLAKSRFGGDVEIESPGFSQFKVRSPIDGDGWGYPQVSLGLRNPANATPNRDLYAFGAEGSLGASGPPTNYDFFLIDRTTNQYVFYETSNRRVSFGSATPLAHIDVRALAATEPAMLLRGAATQTDHIVKVQNSAGAELLAITAAGKLTSASTSTIYADQCYFRATYGVIANDGGGSGEVNIGTIGAQSLPGISFGQNNAGFPGVVAGTGSPEGVVTMPPGSMYLNKSGGAGATAWVKESGSGNTGWVAK